MKQDAQTQRFQERRKELEAELKQLQEQESAYQEAQGKGGNSPVQPGSASRTSTGDPGKYDAPGNTGNQAENTEQKSVGAVPNRQVQPNPYRHDSDQNR